jgi:hypothetical protein
MAPTAIIERFDIFENSGACGGTRLPMALVNQFRFQGSEKAFRDSVVPTISTAAHASDDPVLGEETLVVVAGVLAAAIGMMN